MMDALFQVAVCVLLAFVCYWCGFRSARSKLARQAAELVIERWKPEMERAFWEGYRCGYDKGYSRGENNQ